MPHCIITQPTKPTKSTETQKIDEYAYKPNVHDRQRTTIHKRNEVYDFIDIPHVLFFSVAFKICICKNVFFLFYILRLNCIWIQFNCSVWGLFVFSFWIKFYEHFQYFLLRFASNEIFIEFESELKFPGTQLDFQSVARFL